MTLMRCVVSLALFRRSFKMDLFSLKMRLISLPRSFLKSSKATGLEGGVLGLKMGGGGAAVLGHQVLHLSPLGAWQQEGPASWAPPPPDGARRRGTNPSSVLLAHEAQHEGSKGVRNKQTKANLALPNLLQDGFEGFLNAGGHAA